MPAARKPKEAEASRATKSSPTKLNVAKKSKSKPKNLAEAKRTYIIDTSVLLSDPRALLRFAEHDVVLPVVVITELEVKRSHP